MDAVKEPLAKAKERVDFVETFVLRDAVHAVVRSEPATAALVAAHKAALKQLVGLRRALQFLDVHDCLPDKGWMYEEEWTDLPGAAPWLQTLKALQTDADAPLP